MEYRDPSGYHYHPHPYASPASHHNLNLHQQHQQPQPLYPNPHEASSASSLSFFSNPNPNPNASSVTGYENPLISSATAAASHDLRPPGVDRYHTPYAAGLAYDGAHTISSQSYPQTAAGYYYQYQQQQQQFTMNPFTYGAVETGNTIADLETKRRKVIAGGVSPDSVRVCTICNVVCNSDKVFAFHLAGEKHSLKAFGIPSNTLKPKGPPQMQGLYPTNKARQAPPRAAPVTAAKKASKGLITFVQSSFCDVCQIDCNSQEVLSNHELGKKHLKNLRKLQGALNPKPADEPSKNSTEKAKPSASESESKAVNEQPKQSAAAAPKEDLETKKLKVLSGGAAADAVRVCTYCDVVCNSQMVYNSHIVGKRHIATMNKQQQAEQQQSATVS